LTLLREAEKKNIRVCIYAFELHTEPVEMALELFSGRERQVLLSLLDRGVYADDLCEVRIYFGDAREKIRQVPSSTADCVFLDPFSPPVNPQLWTVEFFKILKSKLRERGKILTYSSALPVISAFRKAGFYPGYTPPVGRKRAGLIAALDQSDLLFPLNDRDLYFLSVSVRAVPNYGLKRKKEEIQLYREELKQRLVQLEWRIPHKKAQKIFQKSL
jgi:hypothetical protein